ncbi:MAG: hypothetical protein AVDCRST_MAG70-1416 [uncultured Thermomicrobiales bacterium]|uniref:Uncharacterized protein n=1 Tax=uncultured Thermomicrobiales bacterium TaxID=1645740 RepID=A0A6J4US86_9BACT|nr:MAG: hypothetical protein AVDCRST_MAG70-1416 [uncultured Thermomicrobiales bacterium]
MTGWRDTLPTIRSIVADQVACLEARTYPEPLGLPVDLLVSDDSGEERLPLPAPQFDGGVG